MIAKVSAMYKSDEGGIFDEAMLLAAKGLLLIIIISGLTISVISVLERFNILLEIINSSLPE